MNFSAAHREQEGGIVEMTGVCGGLACTWAPQECVNCLRVSSPSVVRTLSLACAPSRLAQIPTASVSNSFSFLENFPSEKGASETFRFPGTQTSPR